MRNTIKQGFTACSIVKSLGRSWDQNADVTERETQTTSNQKLEGQNSYDGLL